MSFQGTTAQFHLKAVGKNECFHGPLNSILSVCSLAMDHPPHQSPTPREVLGTGKKRRGRSRELSWVHSADPQRDGWPCLGRASHWRQSFCPLPPSLLVVCSSSDVSWPPHVTFSKATQRLENITRTMQFESPLCSCTWITLAEPQSLVKLPTRKKQNQGLKPKAPNSKTYSCRIVRRGKQELLSLGHSTPAPTE